MAGRQQQWTILQEPVDYHDYQQQRDHFPLLPRGNQHEQASNQPPQASYSPQDGYQPPQASHSPQHGSGGAPQQTEYSPQHACYPLQQGYSPQPAGYPPWQASYQPQDAGYIPQQSQQVIHQQPASEVENGVIVGEVGESSFKTVCPHCQITVVTSTHRVPGFKAWLCLPLGCALFGCLVLCCLDDFMDVVHRCPFCENKIAIYEQPI